MSVLAALDNDVKAIIAAFPPGSQNVATALGYASKINLASGWAAIKDAFSDPAKAATDGSVENLLTIFANGAKIVGIVDPAVAIVANDAEAVAIIEPWVASLIEMLAAANGGKIPQVTLDTEIAVDSQLGPQGDVFKPES